MPASFTINYSFVKIPQDIKLLLLPLLAPIVVENPSDGWFCDGLYLPIYL